MTFVICSALGVKCFSFCCAVSYFLWTVAFSVFTVCQSLPARACEVSSGGDFCVCTIFAIQRCAFPFSGCLLVAQLVGCPWSMAEGGFECVRPGNRSEEKCCLDLFNEESWSYNYVKQVCKRDACEDGSYFDEEANELGWNASSPESSFGESRMGGTIFAAGGNIRMSNRPQLLHLRVRQQFPDEAQCGRTPPSEPETPLDQVPLCFEAHDVANCTLSPDGRTFDGYLGLAWLRRRPWRGWK